MPFSGFLELVAVVVTEALHGTLTAEDGGEVGGSSCAWCGRASLGERVEGVGEDLVGLDACPGESKAEGLPGAHRVTPLETHLVQMPLSRVSTGLGSWH